MEVTYFLLISIFLFWEDYWSGQDDQSAFFKGNPFGKQSCKEILIYGEKVLIHYWLIIMWYIYSINSNQMVQNNRQI